MKCYDESGEWIGYYEIHSNWDKEASCNSREAAREKLAEFQARARDAEDLMFGESFWVSFVVPIPVEKL